MFSEFIPESRPKKGYKNKGLVSVKWHEKANTLTLTEEHLACSRDGHAGTQLTGGTYFSESVCSRTLRWFPWGRWKQRTLQLPRRWSQQQGGSLLENKTALNKNPTRAGLGDPTNNRSSTAGDTKNKVKLVCQPGLRLVGYSVWLKCAQKPWYIQRPPNQLRLV